MLKDEILNNLADKFNVAQFISFDPKKRQRFSCVAGYEKNYVFDNLNDVLFNFKTVNIRTFKPEQTQGNPFLYGVSPFDAENKMKEYAKQGYYTIINETVDIDDGGVSGVAQGGCMEFAPGVTPRFVEVQSEQSLPIDLGIEILKTIYKLNDSDFNDFIYEARKMRIEFSFHPKPCGFRKQRIIVWETGDDNVEIAPHFKWPNAFSRFLGDKAYGLLLGWLLGENVPFSEVYMRNTKVDKWHFGKKISSGKLWTRTCPKESVPGFYDTLSESREIVSANPYILMKQQDPQCEHLRSCIVQDGVDAKWAGSLITDCNDKPIIEGVRGYGDSFMLGQSAITIPENIIKDVLSMYARLKEKIGFTRFEWAHDGENIWLLQLHQGKTQSNGRTIVPGNPDEWIEFEASNGLKQLYALLDNFDCKNGVRLLGKPGITSHLADLLRKKNIISEIA